VVWFSGLGQPVVRPGLLLLAMLAVGSWGASWAAKAPLVVLPVLFVGVDAGPAVSLAMLGLSVPAVRAGNHCLGGACWVVSALGPAVTLAVSAVRWCRCFPQLFHGVLPTVLKCRWTSQPP